MEEKKREEFGASIKITARKIIKNQPTLVIVYMWCSVIAVLKKEILGQFISTTDIMQILITNLDDNMEEIKKAKEYIKKVYKETYKEEPYWTE